MNKTIFSQSNIEFFFNLSEKIDVFVGNMRNYDYENLNPKEILQVELEKLEVIYNENGENSLEIIFNFCFG